jgi:hypothetical protein
MYGDVRRWTSFRPRPYYLCRALRKGVCQESFVRETILFSITLTSHTESSSVPGYGVSVSVSMVSSLAVDLSDSLPVPGMRRV